MVEFHDPSVPYSLSLSNSATRGSCGFSLASSRMISRLRSSLSVGITTSTVTIWSPRCYGRPAFSTPRSRMRSFCPLCVPGGIFNCARPSMVGTSTFAPSDASAMVTGTVS